VASELRGTYIFTGGTVSFGGTLALPSNCVVNATVTDNTLASTKMLSNRRTVDVELFGPTTSLAALTKLLHIVRGASGTLVSVEVAVTVAAGGDRAATVDLQKSTGAGAFATVLSAPIAVTNGLAVRTATAGTISSASLTDGDILQAVVAVSGTTGAYHQGLILTLTYDEYTV
jgi:hypothetical protein